MKNKIIVIIIVTIGIILLSVYLYFIISKIYNSPQYTTSSNSVQELTSSKINDLKSEIDKLKAIDSLSDVYSDNIKDIIKNIKDAKWNSDINDLFKINNIKEYNIYKSFIEPITDVIDKYDIILDNKYSTPYIKESKSRNKSDDDYKNININEEVSKVFYSVFPEPQNIAIFKSSDKEEKYSLNSFEQSKDILCKSLTSLRQDIENYGGRARKNMGNNIDLLNQYLKDLEELKVMSLSRITLYLAFPLFAAIVIILFAIPRIYKNTDLQKYVFEKNTIKEVITIFMLISTIILLGLSKIISEDIIGTLLGGISVYVLQKGFDNNENDKNKSKELPENPTNIKSNSLNNNDKK